MNRRRYLFHLVKNQVQNTYRNSFLGIAWVFLPSLAKVAIYSVVFGTLMAGRLPGIEGEYAFVIYLITGILLWEAFTMALLDGVKGFYGSRALILSGMLPKSLVPLVVLSASMVTLAINLGILFVLLGFLTGVHLESWSSLLLLVILQQVFGTALGIILGVLRTFFADIEHMVGIGIQVWFWATPIVYPLSILPESARFWILLNPMTYFVQKYRAVFLENAVLGIGDYIPGLVIAAVSVLFAWLVYSLLKVEMESAL